MGAQSPPQPKLSTGAVVVFYVAMSLLSWGFGWWFADRNILAPLPTRAVGVWVDVLLGAGGGAAVVGLSRLLEWKFTWARQLSAAMRALLGSLDRRGVIWWAVSSAIGEELFFRALLQPWLGLAASSVIFGVLHMGPDKRYWPWTVMAIAMGFGFGGMYAYTGSVLGPILAHFTINFFNLHALVKPSAEQR